ncbi:transcription antitermination factor NusG [Lacibacter cauensis]|uniref:Transcription antitermination factor NusG n=1 Tax=Lacibacter cauensis TaxID=510947 RepID=A0A562SJP8_9BACT|nr:UpxY family transcription antiterminator [Lacibacter cauensis]TWI81432.1 transcription antitermination factor NusG [Lacibacter cauensis]
MKVERYWYAVYTKPRWEKKICQQLERKGLVYYCPMTKVRRKWSDRYKVIEEPLFKSYVFVHVNEAEKPRIRLTDGVVNFLYWNGKPAVIKEAEIAMIRKFLNEYKDVEARPIQLAEGQKVRVKSGLLMDTEGIVIKVTNNKAYVLLESLGYELSAQFEKGNLEPVELRGKE